jgi:WD40 repeat protein
MFDVSENKQAPVFLYQLENAVDDDILCMCLDPLARVIYTGSGEGTLKIFLLGENCEPPEMVYNIRKIHNDEFCCLALDTINGIMCTASQDKSVKIFDTKLVGLRCDRRPPKLLYHIQDAHKFGINSICMDPINKNLYTASWDRSVKIWCLKEPYSWRKPQYKGDIEANAPELLCHLKDLDIKGLWQVAVDGFKQI